MLYLVDVLIGRAAQRLDRTFTYVYEGEEKPSSLVRVTVDFGRSKDVVGFIVGEPRPLEESPEEYTERTGIKLGRIKGILDRAPIVSPELDVLAHQMAERYLCPLISVYQAMLPPSLKPSSSSIGKPVERFEEYALAREGVDESGLNSNERKMLAEIRGAEKGLKLSAQTKKKVSFQSLLSKGNISVERRRVNRIKQVAPIPLPGPLTREQSDAVEGIERAQTSTVLLQGVTGSGKSLIYLKLARRAVSQGKGAVVLVPEIALTDRLASLFKGAFGDRVSILHSSLSPASKYDEYLRIRDGDSRVVVGTRSAVFAPVKDLGIICIDEEQSSSYKQDSTPYYDARTVAQMRSAIEGARVVLGSATPLVEDRARADRGIFTLVRIRDKYSETPEVEAEFVDMSDLANLTPESRMISKPLAEALAGCISRGEQAILLLNRRGFATAVVCRNCQTGVTCQDCLIPMTYHRRWDSLFCHRCERRIPFEGYKCRRCGGESFFNLGYGTERVSEDLRRIIPGIRVERLDRDSATESGRERILRGFREGEFDVLVGTQMVAKGHDFPRVTLACALSADQSLAIPDYRAAEDTFDLISQLVGRSGRADIPGRAIIQTYCPTSWVLQLAARQDYEAFYAREIEDRRRYMYPPYCFLADVRISGRDREAVNSAAYGVKSFLASRLAGKRVNIYGPLDSVYGLVEGKVARKVTLKYKDLADISEALRDLPSIFAESEVKGVDISVDVDSRSD